MVTLIRRVSQLKIVTDVRGQDFLEYALLLAFFSVSVGAVVPGIADSVVHVFEKVENALNYAINGAEGSNAGGSGN